MSSTNRGSERVEKDNYPTPAWCVERLFEYTRPIGNVWLEPCVGDGAIARLMTQVLNTPRVFVGVDVRDTRANARASGCTDFLQCSYLDMFTTYTFDSIITNPPYSLAFEIIQKAVKQAPWVAMLLPLNFAASAKRCAWFQANTPSVLVLPDRPNFVRCYSCPMCGKKWVEAIDQEPKRKCIHGCEPKIFPNEKLKICESDSNDYGWFVWGLSSPKFLVLNTTPLEVRRPSRVSLGRELETGSLL